MKIIFGSSRFKKCLSLTSLKIIFCSLANNDFIKGARLTTPLAYTVVYSSLLVRLVCLRSLHRGVYLPTPYQALLLLFCVLVQVLLVLLVKVNQESHKDFS